MCCGNVLITKIVGTYFMIKLRDLLEESFKSMGIVERSFVLCCELCEENFESLLNCCGGIHVLDQVRKVKLYGAPGSTQQLQQLFEYYYYSCP